MSEANWLHEMVRPYHSMHTRRSHKNQERLWRLLGGAPIKKERPLAVCTACNEHVRDWHLVRQSDMTLDPMCPRCMRRDGYVNHPRKGWHIPRVKCCVCDGTGELTDGECHDCGGSGWQTIPVRA